MSDKLGVNLEKFKKLVDDSTVSRQVIAKKIGCDVSTITKHYNGDRNITVDYVIKYAKYFKVSTDFLLDMSDVPTTDKDIQFICDYTGLEEKSIENIRIKEHILLSTEYPVEYLAFGSVFLLDKYIEFYDRIINDFLQSNCLLNIVVNCCYEKILEYLINDMVELKNKGFDNLSECEKDKLLKLTHIVKKYDKQHKLNLFDIQDSALDFAKSITDIQNINKDSIMNMVTEIIIELGDDESLEDE